MLVSEDLATGGIRAHLVSAKGNGDPWIAREIKYDIEEFGYGGALENGIKKVRNIVKTTLSILESRWGVRVARDHPVYPWVFEWAADLMTRYGHVGDLGKTAVQLIRGSKSSRNIAQFGKNILYEPLKLSGHLRGNMEDTFLERIFLGMRLRSDEILIGTARGVIKTRALQRRVEEEQWDREFAKTIKGEPRQLVLGINSDLFLAAVADRAGVRLEEDQADARLGQQDQGIDPPEAREVSMPPDRLVTQIRSDTLKRMYVTIGLGKKYVQHLVVQDVPRMAVITKPVTRTDGGTGCLQNWRRVKRAEILPENTHVWMLGNRSNPLHQATDVLCQRNGIAHQRNSGEWVKRI